MQSLDPLRFPLSGTRLIEASAGTGKTYTIAALYLRFLLEAEREVDQILVVTFTTAATQELRDRIRRRIHEALTAFEADHSDDAFLTALLQRIPDHEFVRQRLRNALARMDEAAIFTIHGFCQRTLANHAFESGALFESELAQAELPYLQAVCEDFWRQRFYPLSAEWAALVQTIWASPAELLAAIHPHFRDEKLHLLPEAGDLDALHAAYKSQVDEARTRWQQAREIIMVLLLDSPALSRAEKSYRQDRLLIAETGLQVFFDAPETPLLLPDGFALFTTGMLSESVLDKARKKGMTAPEHPFFDCCQALAACQASLQLAFFCRIHTEATRFCREELARRKAQLRIRCFDDLLGDLHQGLHGEAGEALAARIASQYPVALIDEFQDTDPIQYGIFRRLYQGFESGTLLMIGDPKQAIYSFRGADIFTYMQARRDVPVASGHYTLDTNWRASAALIQAVNCLFGQARAPFIHDADIVFQPVKPGGKADENPLRIAGEPPVPLQCWFVDRDSRNAPKRRISRDWAKARLSEACAAEILRLLELGAAGRASIGDRPLAARDIAVLVRDRHEAQAIQDALRQSGIASVFLSHDSIFDTEEAQELARLLSAVLEPGREGLLRAALCGTLMGLDALALDALQQDDPAWEAWLQRFHRYQRLWLERGIAAMCQHIMLDLQVVSRLLVGVDGERRLTNFLHLIELLATASREQHGMAGLLRWFQAQCQTESGEQEEWQLRLESDEDLVQVATIHKSKGLEYPVVFLPFAWSAKISHKATPLRFYDASKARHCLDLGSPEFGSHHALAERERLAEDLRLLYVALTRAKYLCYMSWGGFSGAENSALAYLLHTPGDCGEELVSALAETVSALEDAHLRAPLDRLAATAPACIAPCSLPASTGGQWTPAEQGNHVTRARDFAGRIDRSWRVGSYSWITQDQPLGSGEAPDHDALDKFASPADPLGEDVYRFPRGAQTGAFLHHLLEKLDFQRASNIDLQSPVARGLSRFGFDAAWQPVVENWIGRVLDTPLDAIRSLRLRDLKASSCLRELEFHFPVGFLDVEALMAVLAAHGCECRLDFEGFRGMMKGYIDLVFQHQGRFFLADYKSNHLGDRPQDYVPDRLGQAMRDQSYTLQALIYTVALHRYLGQRLRDYDYDRHFGGVFYLFLRGMDPATGADAGVYFEKPQRMLVDALDALFAGHQSSSREVA